MPLNNLLHLPLKSPYKNWLNQHEKVQLLMMLHCTSFDINSCSFFPLLILNALLGILEDQISQNFLWIPKEKVLYLQCLGVPDPFVTPVFWHWDLHVKEHFLRIKTWTLTKKFNVLTSMLNSGYIIILHVNHSICVFYNSTMVGKRNSFHFNAILGKKKTLVIEKN